MLFSTDLNEVINSLEGIAYAVDIDGFIQAVSEPAWSEFANANNGEAISNPTAVVGRPIFDFVAGDEVKTSYRERMEELAEDPRHGRTAFAFRCDSPQLKREMRMAISPLLLGGTLWGFLFHSIIWAEAARPAMGLYDFSGLIDRLAEEHDLPVLRMCSYCQNVQYPCDADNTGEWIDAAEYYRRGGVEEVTISHGICSGCKEANWDRDLKKLLL